MQSTGQAGRHLSQPLHSSGTTMTSTPWLKMAPNWGGQARRQASQLMQIAMSIRSGGVCHFGLRRRVASRSARPVTTASGVPLAPAAAPDGPAYLGLRPLGGRRQDGDGLSDQVGLGEQHVLHLGDLALQVGEALLVVPEVPRDEA